MRIPAALLAFAVLPAAVCELPRPVIDVPRTPFKPKVDADLNDPAWKNAAEIGSLTCSVGSPEGDKPSPTAIRLLWDKDALYVRFIAIDDDLHLPVHGRDAMLHKGDAAEVFIDAGGDAATWYEFQANAAGDLMDTLWQLPTRLAPTEELTVPWDVVARDLTDVAAWDAEGVRHAGKAQDLDAKETKGWVVDFAFPAALLTKRAGGGELKPATLRANFLRYDWPAEKDAKDAKKESRRMVTMNWAPVRNGCPHISPAAMGFLRLTAAAERK